MLVRIFAVTALVLASLSVAAGEERHGTWAYAENGAGKRLALLPLRNEGGKKVGSLYQLCDETAWCVWILEAPRECHVLGPTAMSKVVFTPRAGTPSAKVVQLTAPCIGQAKNGLAQYSPGDTDDLNAMLRAGGAVDVSIGGEPQGSLEIGSEGAKVIAKLRKAHMAAGGQ